MRFDYYYGSQADQFSFIRIPRVMIKDPVFAKLSAYAKLLYSVLLDRMSLSSKNGWFDSANRVYIIYPISEAQDDLGIGKKKAMEVIAELVEFGLLEKKRRGQGLPSILYVKSFMTGAGTAMQAETVSERSEVSEAEPQEIQKTQKKQKAQAEESEVPEWIHQENATVRPEVSDQELQDSIEPSNQRQPGRVYEPETMLSTRDSQEKSDLEQDGLSVSEVSEWALPEVSESAPLEVSKPALLEVPKRAPLMSKTDNNYTYRSYLSHLINADAAGQSRRSDEMGCGRNPAEGNSKRERGNYALTDHSHRTGRVGRSVTVPEDEIQRIQAYRSLICENICYDDLCAAHRFDKERIDGIVDLILEKVIGKDSQIRIASNLYPAEIVRSKFLKLGFGHIEYVLECMDANTTKVRNIKKYLLAALFNASSTMDGYYRAEVNHDMPQYAKRAQ